MEESINNNCSPSSSAYDHGHNNHNYSPPSSSDEISLFLRQILVRSSSSLSSSCPSAAAVRASPQVQPCSSTPPSISQSNVAKRGICDVDLYDRASPGPVAGYGSSAACFSRNVGGNAANVSGSSVAVSENETEEYDCESEVLSRFWFFSVWLTDDKMWELGFFTSFLSSFFKTEKAVVEEVNLD